MKIIFTLITSLLVISLFVAKHSSAQNADKENPSTPQAAKKETPPQIRIYIECIEISAFEFADLMSSPSSTNNNTKMRNTLMQKIKAGQAKLLSNHSITVPNKNKATIESVKEYIYATEYEPAETANSISFNSTENSQKIPVLPPNPTAFETRNLGYTLEIEPTIDKNNRLIHLRIAPEYSRYIDDHVFSEWKTESTESKLVMPNLYTMRLNSSADLQHGEFLLLNTFSPELDGKTDFTKKILHFARAEIITNQ